MRRPRSRSRSPYSGSSQIGQRKFLELFGIIADSADLSIDVTQQWVPDNVAHFTAVALSHNNYSKRALADGCLDPTFTEHYFQIYEQDCVDILNEFKVPHITNHAELEQRLATLKSKYLITG